MSCRITGKICDAWSDVAGCGMVRCKFVKKIETDKSENAKKNLTEREIVDLANKCATRVCTTDNHHGCPYGDDGIMDCVERLASDYDATIDRLLDMADRAKKAGL